MTSLLNRSWLLGRRPVGAVTRDDFTYSEALYDEPELSAGDIFVRSRIFSCAPTIRNWLNPPSRSYRSAINIGDPIRGLAALEIIRSSHPDFAAGEFVTGIAPWQDYAILTPDTASVPITRMKSGVELVDGMTLYSMNTLTAYFGVCRVGQAAPGDTVLVSGAAGSVGSMACQIARNLGCNVIGIAGGVEKCRWLREVCGITAIDYKDDNFLRNLNEACRGGVNLFFDNVGGIVLESALDCMAPHGRIAVSGQISAYDTGAPAAGPSDMMKLVYGRIRMEGFLVGDFADAFPGAWHTLQDWIESRALVTRADVRRGFDKLPDSFLDIFSGKSQGSLLVTA